MALKIKSLTRSTRVCLFPCLALQTFPIPLLSLLSSPHLALVHKYNTLPPATGLHRPPATGACAWNDLTVVNIHFPFKSLTSLIFQRKLSAPFINLNSPMQLHFGKNDQNCNFNFFVWCLESCFFPLLCKIYRSDFAHDCSSYAWQRWACYKCQYLLKKMKKWMKS